MNKIVMPFFAVLILGALLHAQTLEEVLALNRQARGGPEKHEPMSRWKMTGKIVATTQGVEMPMTVWRKRPDKMRVETVLQDKIIVQAFDGKTAWWIMPFHSAAAQEMPAEQAGTFAEQAVFVDPFAAGGEKGQALELLGREEMDGVPVFHLKRTRADGRKIDHFLDAASGLELKSSRTVKMGESEALAEILYGDYRPAGGLVMPFAIENRLDGRTQVRMTFDEIEIDPVMDDAMFAMPGKTDKEEKAGNKQTPGSKKKHGKKRSPGGKGGK